MKLIVVDTALGIMRVLNDTFRAMSQIELESLPAVKREPVEGGEMRIVSTPDSVVSIVMFRRLGPVGKGGLLLRLMRQDIAAVLGPLGIARGTEMPMVRDAFSEFCNVATGGFKTEIRYSGYKKMELSRPESYAGRADEPSGVETDCKYVMDFNQGENHLITVELFMEKPEA